MRNNYLSSSFNSVVSLDMDSSWAAKSWDLSNIYWNQNGNQVGFNKPISKDLLTSGQEHLVSTNLNRGKVRQLFLERRGKGWDRSNPLEPIKPKNKTNRNRGQSPLTKSLSNLPDYYIDSVNNQGDIIEHYTFPTRLPNIGGIMQQPREGSSTPKRTSRIPQLKNTTKTSLTDEMKKLKINSKKTEVSSIGSGSSGDLSIKAETKVGDTPPPSSAAKPKITKKMPINGRGTPISQVISNTSTPKSTGSLRLKSSVSSPEPKNVSKNLDPDKAECPICGRAFLKDRIQVHESICKKAKTKKRKVFDPVKHRLAGTEAESYLRKGSIQHKTSHAASESKPKSDWRKKHEEFIASIRAAKQVQEHLAKGGKLSDLPPPPPMDTSDYVQCQHCKRKFNAAVAERHIPICSKVKSNKPAAKRPVKK